MTEFMGLAEKVSKFNQEALKHLERQTLNPFSGRFSRSPSPRPKFNKDEYGKPAAGSKTELRGQRAFTQISKEILELCEVIHDMGARKRDDDGDECIIIPFGELFAFYTKISDKVVGLLIAAKKRGFVYFEPEILFQRRDDDVLIALLKPIEEIRNVINRQVSASPSPAPLPAGPDSEKTSPCPTPSPLARQDSNTSVASASITAEPETPTPVSAAPVDAENIPSSSNAENVPQQTATTVITADTNSTIPESSVSTEEDNSSPVVVVETKLAPVPEVPVELELTPSVTVVEPEAEEKGHTPTTEPLQSHEGETVSSSTEAVNVKKNSEEPISTPEYANSLEPDLESENHDSLSLKILVPVNETPNTSTSVEPELSASGEESALPELPSSAETSVVPELSSPTAEESPVPELPSSTEASAVPELPSNQPEQAPLSPDVAASTVEETPSPPQVAPDDNENNTTSSTTTIEVDQTQPPTHKTGEIVPPTDNEQTPPSNDTGEKTLA